MNPTVAVLTTGGTIAGVSYGDYFTAGNGQRVRPYKVELSGKQLLDKFPHLKQIANIELQELGIIDSVNMNSQYWNLCANSIYPFLQRHDIAGIVLTHGTDTMEYTSMALALMLQNLNKPVVMTGAMLPADQDENHVQRHLEDSIRLAAYSSLKEVIVCFSGDKESTYTSAYPAAHVQKIRSRGSNAFESPWAQPLASVRDGKIEYIDNYTTQTHRKNPVLKQGFIPVTQVSLALDDISLRADYTDEKGILVNSDFGLSVLGNTNRVAFIEKHLELGIPVAIRTTSDLDLEHYNARHPLLDKGAAFLGKMPFSKAITKLGWAVAQTNGTVPQTKELMEKNVAGEIVSNYYM